MIVGLLTAKANNPVEMPDIIGALRPGNPPAKRGRPRRWLWTVTIITAGENEADPGRVLGRRQRISGNDPSGRPVRSLPVRG
jgi:hypothetical protein